MTREELARREKQWRRLVYPRHQAAVERAEEARRRLMRRGRPVHLLSHDEAIAVYEGAMADLEAAQ